MINRRTLFGFATAALAGGTHAVFGEGSDVSLGAVGAEVGLLVGSAFDREIFEDDAYRGLIALHCRIGTLENSLKFDWLRPHGSRADFTMADQLVAFAARNNIQLRGTALAWNDNAPPWLARLSTSQLIAAFDRHIDETVSRYRGRLHSWDVVNEPFLPVHGLPGGYRKGPWYSAMGKDYIPRAFRRAAAADPAMRCVLNEAFCEQDDALGRSVRPPLLRLVDELRDAGVPLHAVGLQAHLKPHLPFDDGKFVEFLMALAERKVDLYITELDVDDSGFPDDIGARDAAVARRHGEFLNAVLAVPAVKVVVTWHLSDKYSWYGTVPWYGGQVRKLGGNPSRRPRTHLFDADLRPKPSVTAVINALASRKI